MTALPADVQAHIDCLAAELQRVRDALRDAVGLFDAPEMHAIMQLAAVHGMRLSLEVIEHNGAILDRARALARPV